MGFMDSAFDVWGSLQLVSLVSGKNGVGGTKTFPAVAGSFYLLCNSGPTG